MRTGTNAVLLDLDGTLSDSRPGIAASFRFMLAQLGHDPDAAGDLTWAVGPPIAVSVRGLLARYGDDRDAEALAVYRARYSDVGIYDCTLYAGTGPMMASLRAAGMTLCIATSKRRDFAERVIDHLGIRQHLRAVYGAEPGGGLDDKQDLIAHILGVESLTAATAVMVGDRLHDIHAAQANKVRSIGVTWGYGGREELETAGADAVASTPGDVTRLLLG